jgi:phosphoglycolate phosphatase-like HAD superfamily hydrolase
MEPIVFDWDGTLADSLGSLYQANVEVLTALGVPFDVERYRAAYSPDWREFYARLGVPGDRLDEANRRWLAAYDGGASVELFPGIGDALEALAAAGHPLGIVTAGRRDIVEPQLARTGIADLFGAIVYADDEHAPKPDPAPLRHILGRLRPAGDPARATYIGDVPDDMRMARAAGVRGVGIVSVFGTAEVLFAAGADEIVATVTEWVAARVGAPARATGA